MISICAVVLDSIKHYEDIFLASILKKTSLVTEVILAKNDSGLSFYEEWEERGIKFKKFGNRDEFTKGAVCGQQHGYGLNNAIDRATNDLVLLSDPDIFFYSAVDDFYFQLMMKHGLNAVGCSHHSATELGQRFFPWHGNVLLKKSELPTSTWLEGELEVKGKFLLPGAGYSQRATYPNPDGNFDTSSGLWLWSNEQNWKWLSFQTTCANVYSTVYYRTNAKIRTRFDFQNLIYHAVSGAISEDGWKNFELAYKGAM